MEFKYVAFTKGGTRKEGTVEADDADKAAGMLHEKGWTVVQVSEASAFGLEKLVEKNIGGVPIKDKVLFYRQMAYMLGAGLPLVSGLEVLHKQAKNKAMQKALKVVVEDVRGGAQLNVAMKKHPEIFDKITINLVKAGEESGNMEKVFDRLATDFEKQQKFMSKVRGAMIYPIIILGLVIVVIVVLMIFMVPAVEELFAEFDADLPFATALMINISRGIRGIWGIVILLVIISGLLFLRYYRSKPEGRKATDGLVLKLPIIGEMMKKSLLAQFARTFSMLLSSGVEILDAIDLTADSLKNEVLSSALRRASKTVEKGGSLAKVVAGFEEFPPIVAEMMTVGEKTGKLDEIVSKMGDYFEDEADQMATNLTKSMEPIIMVVVGLVVAFIALAVYTPIFKLGNVVK